MMMLAPSPDDSNHASSPPGPSRDLRAPRRETARAIGKSYRTTMPGFMTGDHASLALDPSFWPIHPCLERLYQVGRCGGMSY